MNAQVGETEADSLSAIEAQQPNKGPVDEVESENGDKDKAAAWQGLLRVKWWGFAFLALFWIGFIFFAIVLLSDWPNEQLDESLARDGIVALIVALIYLQVLLIARWLLIANPYRTSLGAEIETLRGRLEATADKKTGSTGVAWRTEAEKLLDTAEKRLAEPDPFFWSWGDQKAAAQLIAAAEMLSASALSPTEAKYRLDIVSAEIDRYVEVDTQVPTVLGKLQAAVQQIERDRVPPHLLHGASATSPDQPETVGPSNSIEVDSSDFRILHANALEVLHRLEIAEFARILKWHRKVLWITVSGLILLVLLAAFLGNGELLLLGAAGAYLSRLTRIIRRADAQPEDVSSYWTNLLLGPLLGALAAYGGILLIDLMKDFQLLGGNLDDVNFATGDETLSVLTLSLAFAFGFTEGLVNRIASGVDTALTGRPDPSEISASSSKSGPNQST